MACARAVFKWLEQRGGCPARIQFIHCWRTHEELTLRTTLGCRAADGRRPGRSAAGWGRSAVHNGVLLQGAMGPSTGISAALPEESLSPAPEDCGDRPHAFREDRAAV